MLKAVERHFFTTKGGTTNIWAREKEKNFVHFSVDKEPRGNLR